MRERIAVPKPVHVERRPAAGVIARAAGGNGTVSRARGLQERIGNAATGLLIARAPALGQVELRSPGAAGAVQRFANVSSPHDRAEMEAHQTARTIMRMAAPTGSVPAIAAHREPLIQRVAERPHTGTTPDGAASLGHGTHLSVASAAGGEPLPVEVRTFMEVRFGAQFGGIRIHRDESAARESERLDALAFTVGNHIHFGRNQFQPDSTSGKELIAHELTHTIQQGHAVQHRPMTSILARGSSGVQRAGGIRNWLADRANAIPGFRMLTVILGVNPINMSAVERSPANVLRAAVEFIPGGALLSQALEARGIFDRAGAWLSEQLKRLGMAADLLRQALDQFLAPLGVWDLRPTNWGTLWDRAKQIFTEPIERIKRFVAGLASDILGFIRQAILLPLASLAEGTRGYDLLKAVLEQDPITGNPVARTPENLIGGFMKLIGEEELWQNIQKANALARCWTWFQSALKGVQAFVNQIPGRLLAAIKSLDVSDMILVPKAFAKVALTFGGFIVEFLKWGGEAVWHLLQIIFEVLAPGAMPYLKKAAGSFRSILKNPIGFVSNLVKAGKLGFQNFAANIGQHLKASLLEWLTGSLPGVYIPQKLELGEILKFVMSVLGISWANIRQKLVKAVGEPAVKAMEVGFDIVVTLVRDGPAAAWDKIKEQLSNLKDMVIKGITDFVVETIVKKAVAKVVSLLVPGGAFIQAIVSIYDTIMVFVDKLQNIIQVAKAFLDSVMDIASGAIEGAANKVESTLAGLLTLSISFLAGFLGLGKIADKVMEIINTKVRAPIDKALDFLVNWIVKAAKSLFAGAKSGVKALLGWAKSKAGFSDGEGAGHSVYVDDSAGQPQLVIASKPTPARAFLMEYIKQKDASYQEKNKTKISNAEAAIAAAEKQVKVMGEGNDNAQQAVLLNLNVAVGKALSGLLNSDEEFAKAEEKYLLEGLSGTYSSMPKPKGDGFTADHQPQAAILQAAAKFKYFKSSGELVERAEGRAKEGFAINLHRLRHEAGRTYGSKGADTKEKFLQEVKAKVTPEQSEAQQRKVVVKVLKSELAKDVEAIMKVVADEKNFSDLAAFVSDPKKEKKLRTEVQARIVAGENQVAAQDLDSLAG